MRSYARLTRRGTPPHRDQPEQRPVHPRHGCGHGAKPVHAQPRTEAQRLRRKPKCAKLRGALRTLVEGLLAERWSPEQISGWLARQGLAGISHAAICRHVWLDRANGGGLHRHLRQGGRRRKRYGAKEFRGRIPHRVDISERPPVVDSRERLGDWEADTVPPRRRSRMLLSKKAALHW